VMQMEETHRAPDLHLRSSTSPMLDNTSSQGICSLGSHLITNQLQPGPHIDPSSSNLFLSQPQALPGPHIDPSSSSLFLSQPQALPGPHIDPSSSSLFLSQPQALPGPHIDPSSSSLFLSQLHALPGPHIDPSSSNLFLIQPQEPSIPDIDHLTPHSLRLSSPDLIHAIGNVIDNIQQTIDKEACH
jgi:hypothetical protein